eukprot:302432-Prymnesium_polylepis.1
MAACGPWVNDTYFGSGGASHMCKWNLKSELTGRPEELLWNLKSEFTGRPEELLVIVFLGDAEITYTHRAMGEI